MGKFKKDILYTYTSNFELSQSGFPCLQDDKRAGISKFFFTLFFYILSYLLNYWGQSINAKNVHA